ncbi:MAG: HPF/RaiA family ribosome-associated protein [Gemmatimonadales bacterium]|nr:HPF/RaiA family ribosome-associated protein [Gemmatimonadales bacterium]
MQVQISGDSHITADDTLVRDVEGVLTEALGRFGERITRVEVHLRDENAHKAGPADKRCLLEARLSGRPPVAVHHDAATIPQALDGAVQKLQRSIESQLGRAEGY